MKWVLDTNVILELRRAKPSIEVANWITRQQSNAIWTSRVCLAEIHAGIVLQSDTAKRDFLQGWYSDIVLPMFENKIVEVDEVALSIWLKNLRIAKEKQSTAPPVDFLIAATCHAENSGVITRDVEPFVACGVPTFNPWTGERFNGA